MVTEDPLFKMSTYNGIIDRHASRIADKSPHDYQAADDISEAKNTSSPPPPPPPEAVVQDRVLQRRAE